MWKRSCRIGSVRSFTNHKATKPTGTVLGCLLRCLLWRSGDFRRGCLCGLRRVRSRQLSRAGLSATWLWRGELNCFGRRAVVFRVAHHNAFEPVCVFRLWRGLCSRRESGRFRGHSRHGVRGRCLRIHWGQPSTAGRENYRLWRFGFRRRRVAVAQREPLEPIAGPLCRRRLRCARR